MGRKFFIYAGALLLSLPVQASAQAADWEVGNSNSAVQSLRARAEQFSGSPVVLDSRLNLPSCAARAHLRWHMPGQSIGASCDGFSMVIPLASANAQTRGSRQPVAVKRGDPVVIFASGSGYRVMLEAVAEAAGRPGERIMVRNANSGRRVLAKIEEDGSVRLASSTRPNG